MRHLPAWAHRLLSKRLAIAAALVGAFIGTYALLTLGAAQLTAPPHSPSDLVLVSLLVSVTTVELRLFTQLHPELREWVIAALSVFCTAVGISAAVLGSTAAVWACLAGFFAAQLAVARTRQADAHADLVILHVRLHLLRSMLGTLPEPKHACATCGHPITGSAMWIGDQGPYDSACGRAANQARKEAGEGGDA